MVLRPVVGVVVRVVTAVSIRLGASDAFPSGLVYDERDASSHTYVVMELL